MRARHWLTAVTALAVMASAWPAPARAVQPGDLTWTAVSEALARSQDRLRSLGGAVDVSVDGKLITEATIKVAPGGMAAQEWLTDYTHDDGEGGYMPEYLTWQTGPRNALLQYEPVGDLGPPGKYPTLKGISWGRRSAPAASDIIPSLRIDVDLPKTGDMTSAPGTTDPSELVATWTYAPEGRPAKTVTAHFSADGSGDLLLREYGVADPPDATDAANRSEKVRYGDPQLKVPTFAKWAPMAYVRAAQDASYDTDIAVYCADEAAKGADHYAGYVSRTEAVTRLRGELETCVSGFLGARHPSARITPQPHGVALANTNAYSGVSTRWVITVTANAKAHSVRTAKAMPVRPIR